MIHVELVAADDPRVAAIWCALEPRGPASAFLAWGWIETWLALLPPCARPVLAVLHHGDAPVAAAFFGRRRVTRHQVVTSRSWFLQGTGVPRFDELCVEHVGAVGDPDALGALLERLPPTWDEVVLAGVECEAVAALAGFRVHVDREIAAPFVDLARVREAPGGYLSLLGSSTRAQIRRARRELGELAVEVATDPAHAADIYDALARLHVARWRAAGQPGAFSDTWFDGFHRRLIADRLASGEVQLVRVRAGGRTIGCLYNLVHRGRVAFYQSGLAELRGPHDKPGLVCHAAAIEHAACAGHDVYDFLAGEARYKRNLSTDVTHLVWARIQRPLARFAIENWLQERAARLPRPRGTPAATLAEPRSAPCSVSAATSSSA